MRKLIKPMLAVSAIVTILLIYLNTNFYINRQAWKYRNGGHVGDWLEFNKEYIELKGRKIYKNGEQVGTVKFCFGKMLVVKASKSGETGFYINK